MKQNTSNINHYSLTLGWLYPELMSTYGDRGNVIVLEKIAMKNNIKLEIVRINQNSSPQLLNSCDMLFMGGAQDLQQEIVAKDLMGEKGNLLKNAIENNIPGLFICGAYQFLGHYYKDIYGNKIPGLGIFDMYTQSYKSKQRLIGNIVIKTSDAYNLKNANYLVGFENHGGRTFLTNKSQAFAKVVKGYGNNGEDKTEGIVYKNSIGTYLHGPILPSNPELAVWLLDLALQRKYNKKVELKFDNYMSNKARKNLLNRFGID